MKKGHHIIQKNYTHDNIKSATVCITTRSSECNYDQGNCTYCRGAKKANETATFTSISIPINGSVSSSLFYEHARINTA